MTLQELIDHLDAIPDERWRTGEYGRPGGPRCLLGHVLELPIMRTAPWSAGRFLRALVGQDYYPNYFADVNDGRNANYLQATPKARSLAYLRSFLP